MILSVLCVGVDRGRERQEVIFAGEPVKCEEDFCYLGVMISAGGSASSVARFKSG